MITFFRWLWGCLGRHSTVMTVGGLVAMVGWNWRLDGRDRARVSERDNPGPIRATAGPTPLVSVLVAAWNEAEFIADHIESFRQLEYAQRELVICAGGTDGTFAIARCLAGADVIILEQRHGEGKQRALRRCLEASRGEIVFLTDADSRLDDDSFRATLRPLLEEGERAATGRCRPLPTQLRHPFVAYQWIVQAYGFGQVGRYSAGLLGCNCAIWRDTLVASDGFDRPAPVGTDYRLARQLRQAGVSIRMVTDSYVSTEYPATLSSYVQRQSRWLRNLFFHGLQTRDRRQVAHVLVTWMVAGFGLIVTLAAVLPMPQLRQMWCWFVGYSLIARLRYVYVAGRGGYAVPKLTVALLPAFVLVDWVAWCRAAVDSVSARRRWHW